MERESTIEQIKIVSRSTHSSCSTTNFSRCVILLALQSFLDRMHQTIEKFAGNSINETV